MDEAGKILLCHGCRKALDDSGDNVGPSFVPAMKKNKFKALHVAALHGHDECVNALIKVGADVNMIEKESAMCATVAAVKSGNQRCVELLLEAGADVNRKCKMSWSYKTNALMEAISQGNEKFVELLLQEGADVNDADGTQYRPLDLAAKDGYFKIVDILIKAGANVNEGDLRDSALIQAAKCSSYTRPPNNFIKCIELLLQAGADVNRSNYMYETPLVMTVKFGFDEGLHLLIQAGSDVNKITYGLSPLMRAAAVGFPKCVQLLLTAGADVNETNYNNQTAFSHLGSGRPAFSIKNIKSNEIREKVASKLDLIECGKILLRAGAKINNTDWRDHNNGLKHYIGINRKSPQKDICMFLYAAGETIEGTTVSVSDPNWHPKESAEPDKFHADVPEYLLFHDFRFYLKHLCRQAVRKHLLNLDPHEHLFSRVPKLGLPLPLTRYLLFNFSLED